MTAYDLSPQAPKKPAFAPTADDPYTFVSTADLLKKRIRRTMRPLAEYRYDAHRDGYWVPDSEIDLNVDGILRRQAEREAEARFGQTVPRAAFETWCDLWVAREKSRLANDMNDAGLMERALHRYEHKIRREYLTTPTPAATFNL